MDEDRDNAFRPDGLDSTVPHDDAKLFRRVLFFFFFFFFSFFFLLDDSYVNCPFGGSGRIRWSVPRAGVSSNLARPRMV